MKRRIQVSQQEKVDEIISTFEQSRNLFTISANANDVEFEFEDRYFQFLVDKIEMLGYSKRELKT